VTPPRGFGPRPAGWLLAVLALTVGIASGCSRDNTLPTVIEMPTTTDPDAAVDLVPVEAPLPNAEIVAALQAAAAGGDTCELLAAMDLAQPDSSDPAGATQVYETLATVTAAAQTSVPSELGPDWASLVTAAKRASTAVSEADGDVSDSQVKAAFATATFVEAAEAFERYQLANCGPA